MGFERFDNALMDLVDPLIPFNGHDTLRFAGGNFPVLVINPPVEQLVLALKAVFVRALSTAGAGVAAAGSVKRAVKVRQQEKSKVGLKISAKVGMELKNNFAAKLAASALVGFGRVGEAVTQDNVAAIKRGQDDLRYRLRTVREHETQLGSRRKGSGAGIEQEGADAVTDGGSAGLTGGRNGPPMLLKPICQLAKLSGLARSVEPLEGDKESARHGASVALQCPSPGDCASMLCRPASRTFPKGHSMKFTAKLPVLLSSVLLVCLALTGCPSGSVQVDYDHTIYFRNYRTFSFADVKTDNPFFEKRIEDAVTHDLQSKGLQLVPSDGDLQITAVGAVQNRRFYQTFYNPRFGYYWWEWPGYPGYAATTRTVHYRVGTLVLDMYDGHTRHLVWRAVAANGVTSSPRENTHRLYQAIGRMLKHFPPR